MWEITLESCGNPDFDQYEPQSPQKVVRAKTWKALLAKIEEYIEEYNLGGGNWMTPAIFRAGRLVGFMSYNRRVWKTRGYPSEEVKMPEI